MGWSTCGILRVLISRLVMAPPSRAGSGELWLQNENGVVMHLKPKRESLMLSLGGDAVVIQMNQ
jgi:hypothetical protein